jgi:predicted DNA-binding protein
MSRKKISTTIYVTPEQNDRLKLLHERTKVPVAVYIREGIDLVLKHYAHLLPGQLALDVVPPSVRPREEDEESAPIVPRTAQLPLESVAASGKK